MIGKRLARLGRSLRGALMVPAAALALRRRYGAGVARPRAMRRVVVYPELGLAYNRIKKNANTSAVILLRQIQTGAVEGHADAKWNARRVYDLGPGELGALGAMHLFVIVRNPYSRVLSAFMDKFRTADYQQRHGAFPLTPAGFGAFLHWLEAGGLTRDAHWDCQHKLMLLPLSKYDTVIRFESVREDLLGLLRSRGLEPPPEALAELYPSDRSKRTGSSDRLAEFYTPERAAIVARLYARDFAELDYPVAFP